MFFLNLWSMIVLFFDIYLGLAVILSTMYSIYVIFVSYSVVYIGFYKIFQYNQQIVLALIACVWVNIAFDKKDKIPYNQYRKK